MANYHLHVKTMSRSAGRSAVGAIAYRRGAKMKSDVDDSRKNYTNKHEVIFSEISIPEDSPEWIKDIAKIDPDSPHANSEFLWNEVERHELRINSRLAREVEFSLPLELTIEQNIELARDYIKTNFTSKGMVADWSYHNKAGNPHVHVMLPTRRAVEVGFGNKDRSWNSRTLVSEWRESWASKANEHLQVHGHDVRIDHRSYKELGIQLMPQVHLIDGVTAMNSRNLHTDIMQIYKNINVTNLEIIATQPDALFSKIIIQQPTFSYNDIANNLYSYIQKSEVPNAITEPEIDKIKSSMVFDPALFAKADDSIAFLTKFKIAAILQKIEYHDSVFTVDKIEQELKGLTTNYKQLARAIVQIKNADCVVSLGYGEDGKERFTTATMLAVERNIQDNVNKLQANIFSVLDDKTINKTLAEYELLTGKKLTKEQDLAVRHIVGKESISCIVGRAGTGKSFSLAAAKSIWDGQGNEVYGVALSGIASDGLTKDANMNSRTIASFILSVEAGSLKLSSNSVIVMDEAGMTDSLSMQKMLSIAEQSGAKIVLVGDPAQLQPVGPGASFRAILEKTGFAEINTVYRQKEEWQRQATVCFSKAETGAAMQAYSDNGKVHLLDTPEQAIDKLASDWHIARTNSDKDISKYLVIAHRNVDVQLLNNKLRKIRVANGELTDGYRVKNTVAGENREIKISQNDRIVFLKNDKNLGVTNGRFATISYVNFAKDGRVIDFNVKLDSSDKEITVNPESYNNFDFGYAATVHKTQGVTVDQSFVYGGGNLNSSLTYVAMTRHKEETGFYASKTQYENIDILKEKVSRLDTKDSVLNYINEIDDFASRRAIETNQTTLKQIIVNALVRAKDKIISLVTGIEQTQEVVQDNVQAAPSIAPIDPKQYAKVVGEYVAATRQFGMAYGAYDAKLKLMGFDKTPYDDLEAMAVIAKIPEYQDISVLNAVRNEMAFKVLENLEASKQAISLNKIDVNTLSKRAAMHVDQVRADSYHAAVAKNDLPARNKLAFELLNLGGMRVSLVDRVQLNADSDKFLIAQMNLKTPGDKLVNFNSAINEFARLDYKLNNAIQLKAPQEFIDNVRSALNNFTTKLEKTYSEELKKHEAVPETIIRTGGEKGIYSRALADKLTDNDLHSISRKVANYQINDLLIRRKDYYAANTAFKPIVADYRARGEDPRRAPQFSAFLDSKIAFGQKANEVINNYSGLERALNLYKISPSELEKASTELKFDNATRQSLEYAQIQNTSERRTYELAYEIMREFGDAKEIEQLRGLGVKPELLQNRVNELVKTSILTKAGLPEFVAHLGASKYVDLVVVDANNTNTVFNQDDKQVQDFIIEYLELKTISPEIMVRKVADKDSVKLIELTASYKAKSAAILDKYMNTPQIKAAIDAKADQYQSKGGFEIAQRQSNSVLYQRAITGKLTVKDYDSLRKLVVHDIHQKLKLSQTHQQNVSKGFKH